MILTFLQQWLGYFVQIIPFGILCFYPFSDYLRYSPKKTAVTTCVLFCIMDTIFAISGCFLDSHFPKHATLYVNFVFLGTLVIWIIFFFYMVCISWQKKLFVFFLTMNEALFTTSFCNVIINRINDYIPPKNNLPYEGFTIPLLLIITLPLVLLLGYMLKKHYIPACEQLTPGQNAAFSIFTTVLFFIFGSGLILFNYDDYLFNPMTMFLYFVLHISMIINFVAIFQLFLHINLKFISKIHITDLEHQLTIENEQYLLIMEKIENSRRMRHDLRHHMLTLQGFLDRNETDKAKDYIQKDLESSRKSELIIHCQNPTIDYIIAHYHALASERMISFQYNINVPSQLPIKDSDLSVILGNLLSNALEAASLTSHEDAFINLCIFYSGNMLVITLDNSYSGSLKFENNSYRSTKKEHSGIGLRSITHLAQSYDGKAEFNHGNHEFHSSVVLNLADCD